MTRDDSFVAAIDLLKNLRDKMIDERDSLELEDWIQDLEEAISYVVLSDRSRDDD